MIRLPESLSPALAAPLEKLLGQSNFRGYLTAADAAALQQASGLDQDGILRALVPVAAEFARPAISNYKVGAVARGSSGSIYFGMNMEFPGHVLNASGHGERSAIANAYAHGETRLLDLAVSAAPCGYCRQFLWELEGPAELRILLPGKAPAPLPDFLPQAFGPEDLGIEARLLSPQTHNLWFEASDDCAKAALDAANASYAPYSGCPAGLGIELLDGRVFAGRLAENAAYSPTQGPIEATLALVTLGGGQWEEMVRAILVQKPGVIDHTAETLAVLDAIAPRCELIVVGAAIRG